MTRNEPKFDLDYEHMQEAILIVAAAVPLLVLLVVLYLYDVVRKPR